MENPQMNVGQRLWNVIVSPSRAFRAIKEEPGFLIPAVLFLVIIVASTILTGPETRQYTVELLTKQGTSQSQIDAGLKMMLPMAVIGVIITYPILWLLQAVVLLIYNQIALGEGKFKQFFAVAIFSSVPTVIHQIIASGLIKGLGMKAAMQVNTSLAVLLGSDNQTFLHRLLANFDLFTIWGLALLALGGAITMNKGVKGIGLYILALWIVLAVGMALLGGLFPTPAV
ncbi:MAG: YIP1 family protein [Syntrophomonas sp.]